MDPRPVSQDSKELEFSRRGIFNIFDVMSGVQNHPIAQELHFITCDKWLVFVRKDFDCILNDEPQQAISLFLHLGTGQFLTRVWAKTVKVGFLSDIKGLNRKLDETFNNTFPCTGIAVPAADHNYTDSFTSDVPFLRTYSSSCQFLSKRSPDVSIENMYLCEACIVMKNIGDMLIDEWEEQDIPKEEDEELPEMNFDFNANDELLGNDSEDIKQEMIKSDNPSADEWQPNSETNVDEKDSDQGKYIPDGLASQSDQVEKERHRDLMDEKLECKLCCSKFKRANELKNHNKYFHLMAKFDCVGCSNIFKQGDSYIEHVKDIHCDLKMLPCKACNDSIGLDSWIAHARSCLQSYKSSSKGRREGKVHTHMCRHCPKEFPEAHERNLHQKNDHAGIEGFNCFFCQKKFLKQHKRKLHMEKAHEWGRFQCPVCEMRHKCVPEFIDHICKVHPQMLTIPCDFCNVEVLVEEFALHRKPCSSSKELEARRKWREGLKAKGGLQCRYCDKKFDSHYQRSNHENEIHTGNKYSCQECEYESYSFVRFYYHKKRHTNKEVDMVFCDICGKKMNKSTLKQHIDYVHKRKKDNVQCSDCGQIFERQHQLLKHQNLVHSTDEKFDCEVCGRRFSRVAAKENHMKCHREGTFPCEMCGKLLKRKKTLVSHMRTHTGEKPFQ